jgi:hypothetical protein
MNTIKKIVWSGILVCLLFPLGFVVAAEFGVGSNEFDNPIKFDTISEFLVELLNVILQLSYPVIVVAIIYTGFLFVTAQGNEAKLGKAKTALLWTLIGATIILGAFVLSAAIKGTIDDIKNADRGETQILVIRQ